MKADQAQLLMEGGAGEDLPAYEREVAERWTGDCQGARSRHFVL
jgi:hypothetical protein